MSKLTVTLEIELDGFCDRLARSDVEEYLNFDFEVDGNCSIRGDHPMLKDGEVNIVDSNYCWRD